MNSDDMFGIWQPWQVALADTLAAEMIRRGLTPERVRELARDYMRARAASEGEIAAARPGADPYRAPRWGGAGRQRTAPEPERGLSRGGACPKCGRALEIKRMCPRVSPRIRTQLACTADDCDWMAVSEHAWDYLRIHGLDGHVEVLEVRT